MATRRDFLKSMALASLAASGVVQGQAQAQTQSARPNSPLLQTDAPHGDALGCLGDPGKAPHARNEESRQYLCAPSDGGLYQKEKIPVPEAPEECVMFPYVG